MFENKRMYLGGLKPIRGERGRGWVLRTESPPPQCSNRERNFKENPDAIPAVPLPPPPSSSPAPRVSGRNNRLWTFLAFYSHPGACPGAGLGAASQGKVNGGSLGRASLQEVCSEINPSERSTVPTQTRPGLVQLSQRSCQGQRGTGLLWWPRTSTG